MKELKELEHFVEAYNDFVEQEYGNDRITLEQAISENELGILYTTSAYDEDYDLADDAVDFQVSYIISEKALWYFIDGNHLVYKENFKTFKEMAEDIENSDWDGYYHIINRKLYDLLDSGEIIVKDGYIEWRN